jgi:hypothetical protein
MKDFSKVSTARCRAFRGLAPLAAVALVCACGQRTDSPVVARVGDAVLTLDELHASTPPEYRERITKEQNIGYVKQWIDAELLYQEALRRKLHKKPDIRHRLERMRRDMLSAEFLSRTHLSASQVHISDSAVQAYYENNSAEFVRPKDVVRYAQMVLDNYGLAVEVRNKATAANFLTLAATHSKQPVDDPRSLPYVEEDALPPKVAAALAGAPAGSTRGPVRMEDGYYLLHVLDRQEAGSVAPLEEVRTDIIDNLTTLVQKQEIENLLSTLRMQTDVTLDLETIPGAPGATIDTNDNE